MKKFLLVVAVILSVAMLASCVKEEDLAAVDPNSTEKIMLEVPSGSTAGDISKILEAKGLINSRGAFLYYLKKEKLSDQLKAGEYKLSKSMDIATISEVLSKGEVFSETVTVLIPEGYEFRMIVDKLVSELGIDRDKFIELANTHAFDYRFLKDLPEKGATKFRLEGYLFPATYTFEKGVSELEILTAMLDKFDSEFKDEYYAKASELGMSINEIVTMASIVEREGASLEEFPRIAGVFYNRRKDSMLFQSCATVQYVLEERKENLLYSDLENESPYNTYKNLGLPPGPIASPGAAALNAAINPEKNDYYFFVVSGNSDGKHVFSKTLDEHEAAKAEAYRKLDGE